MTAVLAQVQVIRVADGLGLAWSLCAAQTAGRAGRRFHRGAGFGVALSLTGFSSTGAPQDGDGCGCTSTPTSGLAGLLLALLARRRRR